MTDRIGTIVSARSASSRLPRKALLELGGVRMIEFLLERLKQTKLGGPIIFATTTRQDDDELANTVSSLGVPVFRGANEDVVSRHLDAARAYDLDWVIRVTGDCPFVDAESLDHCLGQWSSDRRADITTTKGHFPIGIDYEVFSTATLAREWPKMSEEEKEHLTLRLYRTELGFSRAQFSKPADWPEVKARFTVDTPDDFERATKLVRRLGGPRFSVRQLLVLAGESCAE